jgi:lipid-binding SYLF domain-containing protein
MMRKTIGSILAVAALCCFGFVGCGSAPPLREMDASISAAQSLLASFQTEPTKNLLREKLRDAKAVLIIIPGMSRGVALTQNEIMHEWRGPAFYYITREQAAGGSSSGAGFSAGKQDLELVVLAMTDKALSWLMSPKPPETAGMKFLQAGDMLGSGGQGSADMILFAKGDPGKRVHDLGSTVVSIDKAGNQAYYGHLMTPAEIFASRNVDRADAVSLQKSVMAAAK